VAVGGTYFLHNGHISWEVMLPAISCGLFSVGVLNVNNIRDIESDLVAGKRSIPVRVGRRRAVIYHWILLTFAFISSILFVYLKWVSIWQLMFLLCMPMFFQNGIGVMKRHEPVLLDPLLKQLAISTLLFVMLFGIGSLIAMN